MTRLYPGQPITTFPTGTWNDLVDNMLHDQGVSAPRVELPIQSRGGQLIVEIEPDEDLIEHGVAILTEPSLLPPETVGEDDEGDHKTLAPPAMRAVVPTAENLTGTCVITIGPIKSGDNKLGKAVIAGLAIARVDIKSAGDKTCGPIANDGKKLESGTGSIGIVWKEKAEEEEEEDKLGVQWCVVLLGGGGSSSDSLIAKITSTIAGRDGVDLGAGTVALGRIEDGKWTEEIEEVTAYNTSQSPIHVPSGGDIMMAAIKVRGDWVLTPLELHQLAQYDVAKDQSIGHDADGEIEWQEDGDCDEDEEEPEE